DYSVSSPAAGVVLNKGDILCVLWSVISKTDTSIDVKLTHGDPQNLQLDMVLCSNIDPKVGQCNYTIGDLPSRRDFAIIVGKNPDHLGFSSFFAIKSVGPLPQSTGCPNFGGHDCPETLPCCSASGFCG
ncbi:23819_t:CDS:2, partial [Racocetra persica]